MASTQFNADAETIAAPEIIIGGKSYVGRVLSIAEWFPFQERFAAQDEIERAEATPTRETLGASAALMLEFLRETFPAQDGVDPIAEIERRGQLAISTTFVRFFEHHLRALDLVHPQSNPVTTDGTDSPDKTTSEPSENANDSERS